MKASPLSMLRMRRLAKTAPAFSLALTLLLAACAGSGGAHGGDAQSAATNEPPATTSDEHANGSGATKPVSGTTQPVAASAPLAMPSTGLLGVTYTRGKAPPAMLDGGWQLLTRVPGTRASKIDFFSVGKNDTEVLVVAKRGKKVAKSAYEYTLSDEMRVPRHPAGVVDAVCGVSPSSVRSVFALVDTRPAVPAVMWAATPDALDLIKPFLAEHLKCAYLHGGRTAVQKLRWSDATL